MADPAALLPQGFQIDSGPAPDASLAAQSLPEGYALDPPPASGMGGETGGKSRGAAHPPMPSATDALAGRAPFIAGATPGSYGDMANFALGGARDFGHNLLTGAIRAAGGALGQFDGPSPNLTTSGDGKIVPAEEHQMRNLEGRATDAAFNVVPPYLPKTMAGRITQAAGGGLLAAPAGPLAVGLGMLGGGGGEAAGELTNNSPWATIPATTLPMLIPGVVAARRGALGDAIRSRTEGMTPADWNAAQALQDRSYASGLPLMATEAMNSPELQQLTSHALASTGGPAISEFTAQRPAQVRALVGRDVLAPAGPEMQPSALGPMAQNAATESLKATEAARTAQSQPWFDKAKTQDVTAAQLSPVLAKMNSDIAMMSDTPKRAEIIKLRDTIGDDKGNVTNTKIGPIFDQLQNFWDRSNYNPANPNALSKGVSGAVTPHASALESVLKTNNDYASGRFAHGAMTPQVDEARALPLRDIAATDNPVTQANSFTPANKDMSGDIRQTAGAMNMQDHTSFPGLVRDYFGRLFESVTAPNQPGDNPKMGFSFAKAVNGTDAQKANNRAMLEGVAQAHGIPTGGLQAGFDNALEILDRTGRIPGIGSQTTPRAQTNAELASGPGTGFARFQLDKPSTYPIINKLGSLGDMYMSRAYRQFAEMITTPGGVQQLRELSMLRPENRRAQVIVGELTGLNALGSQEQQ